MLPKSQVHMPPKRPHPIAADISFAHLLCYWRQRCAGDYRQPEALSGRIYYLCSVLNQFRRCLSTKMGIIDQTMQRVKALSLATISSTSRVMGLQMLTTK